MTPDHSRTQSPAWRPDRLAERLPTLETRGRILGALRDWFARNGFVEVETPALQVAPGAEVHLQGFSTALTGPDGASRSRWLHTSPEFAMKKLLAGGVDRPFQFARVYRNGERSALHHPEFTMLEWYRADETYDAIMADCAAFLRLASEAAGRERMTWRGRSCDPAAEPERLTVFEAFERHARVDLRVTVRDAARPDVAALARLAAAIGVQAHAGDSWDDIFFRILFERIEPKLGDGRATILCEYPISMAALARQKPGDAAVAERFELYVCGVELANAFGELTDAAVQRARIEADMAAKRSLYGVDWPIDEDFIGALASGMPECSGAALGFDRLVMLATGAAHIEETLWLPVA